MSDGSTQENGFWHWGDTENEVEVVFAGKGLGDLTLEEAIRGLVPDGVEPAWLKQVHSATVVDAVLGSGGSADALVTYRPNLALSVVTADCVPVLLLVRRASGERWLAAVHAGWRGIAGRIVPATLERLGGRGNEVTAWVGPAIGRCCYEVSPDVADRVMAGLRQAREERVIHQGDGKRPHLDLRSAVDSQLRERDVAEVRHVDFCTRCNPSFWSYRRDGPRAGRNLAFIYSTQTYST